MVMPQTLVPWHREPVRTRWTYGRAGKPGRPRLDPGIRHLILPLARENSPWGAVGIQGELRNLGIRVGATTIRMLLRRSGLGPAPRRTGSEFLRAAALSCAHPELIRIGGLEFPLVTSLQRGQFAEGAPDLSACVGVDLPGLQVGHLTSDLIAAVRPFTA